MTSRQLQTIIYGSDDIAPSRVSIHNLHRVAVFVSKTTAIARGVKLSIAGTEPEIGELKDLVTRDGRHFSIIAPSHFPTNYTDITTDSATYGTRYGVKLSPRQRYSRPGTKLFSPNASFNSAPNTFGFQATDPIPSKDSGGDKPAPLGFQPSIPSSRNSSTNGRHSGDPVRSRDGQQFAFGFSAGSSELPVLRLEFPADFDLTRVMVSNCYSFSALMLGCQIYEIELEAGQQGHVTEVSNRAVEHATMILDGASLQFSGAIRSAYLTATSSLVTITSESQQFTTYITGSSTDSKIHFTGNIETRNFRTLDTISSNTPIQTDVCPQATEDTQKRAAGFADQTNPQGPSIA